MNYEPIDGFLTRVKQLTRAGSKEMRLTYQEANLLAASLAELLLELKRSSDSVLVVRTPQMPPVIDGGSFKDRAG